MPKSEIHLPDEFASTMQQLVAEAEKTYPGASSREEGEEKLPADEVRDGFTKVNQRLEGLEKMLSTVAGGLPAKSADHGPQLQRIDEHLIALRNTESVNHRLFNSLHQELKEYRDNFLRDTLQKPFIRDLIVLYDDLSGLAAQLQNAAPAQGGAIMQWQENLENAIHALTEIMHRMEVMEIEQKDFVDRGLHKVVTYEPADFAEDDGRIVMRLKRGFIWREQTLRPEEVVAKRFN